MSKSIFLSPIGDEKLVAGELKSDYTAKSRVLVWQGKRKKDNFLLFFPQQPSNFSSWRIFKCFSQNISNCIVGNRRSGYLIIGSINLCCSPFSERGCLQTADESVWSRQSLVSHVGRCTWMGWKKLREGHQIPVFPLSTLLPWAP